MCYSFGDQLVTNKPNLDSLNAQQQWDYYQAVYNVGRQYIRENQPEYGVLIDYAVYENSAHCSLFHISHPLR